MVILGTMHGLIPVCFLMIKPKFRNTRIANYMDSKPALWLTFSDVSVSSFSFLTLGIH